MIVYSIDTEIGKKYDFKTIRHYNDFKELPTVTYEEIYKDMKIEKESKIYFGELLLNGLQNQAEQLIKSKFIPISFESLEDCHYKAGKDMLSLYLI